MNYSEVCAIAKSHHVKPGKLSKTELVKAIQASEGNFDCFASATGGECDQMGCAWREDCFAAARHGE